MTNEQAYKNGQHAALDGFPHHSNPHIAATLREYWSSGYCNPRLPFDGYEPGQNEGENKPDPSKTSGKNTL